MKDAQEEDVSIEGAEGSDQIEEAQAENMENLTDEEKEALARKKAQEEGEAKDKAMKDAADSFTANLPRSGSYDYAKEQADKKS